MGGKFQDNQDEQITNDNGYPSRDTETDEIQSETPFPEEPFHQQHHQDKNDSLLRADIQERKGEQAGIEDPGENGERLPDVLRPEDNPSDGNKDECQDHLAKLFQGRQNPSFCDRIPVFPVLPQQDKGEEKKSMESTPGNESPVRSMPETANEEDDKCSPDYLRLRTPAATERDIDVIAKPRGQGDMPTPPEFRDIPAEIGNVKIPHQLDAE